VADGAVDLGSAYGSIEVDFSKIDSAMSAALNRLDTSVATRLQGIGSRIESVGANITNVGAKLTVALAPITGFVASGLSAFVDFDSILVEIGARTGATADQMTAVENKALEMGQATQFGAADAASAILELLAAGYSLDEAFAAIGPTLDLAAASNMGLAESAGAVTGILSQFQLGADQATRVTDALGRASGASRATLADLTQAFNNVGPVANEFGLSVEDTAATLAVFAQKGILGAEAGTQLKSMLTNMSRQTEDVTGMWDQLGVSMFDTMGNVRPMQDIITDLNGAMEGMSDQERINTIQTLAGSYGQMGLSALLATDGIDGMKTAMDEEATAAEIAAKKMDSSRGVIDRVKSSLETLQFRVLKPLVKQYLEPLGLELEKLINRFTDWAVANPKLAAALGVFLGVLTVLGPALIALGFAITMIGSAVAGLGTLFAGVGAAIGLIFSPIGILLGLIALLGVAFATNFMGFQDAVMSVVSAVMPQLQILMGVVGSIIEAFQEGGLDGAVEAFKANLGTIGAAFTGIWESLKASLPGLMNTLGEMAGVALTWMGTKLLEHAPAILAGLVMALDWVLTTALPELGIMGISLMYSFVSGLVSGLDLQALWDALETALATLSEKMAPWGGAFTKWLDDTITNIGTSLETVGNSIWGWIETAVAKLSEGMAPWGTKFTQWVMDAPTLLIEGLSTIWTHITTWIASKLLLLSIEMQGFKEKITAWIGDAIPDLIIKLGTFWDTLNGSITGMATAILTSAEQIGTSAVDGIKNGINNAWGGLTGFIEDKAGGMIDSFMGAIGAQSPSRLFAAAAENIPTGIAMGVETQMPTALASIVDMANQLFNAAQMPAMQPAMVSTGQQITQNFGDINLPPGSMPPSSNPNRQAQDFGAALRRQTRKQGGGIING
jgi:TP901 family phage tail tape measure protein